jgi:8-oxo-dGTP diphosphatase
MGVPEKYSYEFPRPAFTADNIIFTYSANTLKILLIERKNEPFKGSWAFPGGFVDENEPAILTARRELIEETGLNVNNLEMVYLASKPGRDPRGWVISAIFLGFVNQIDCKLQPGDDAKKAEFHSVHCLPTLGFDHADLMEEAFKYLKNKIRYQSIAPDILPQNFEFSELESLYSQIIGSHKEARFLADKLKNTKIIIPSMDEKLYSFDYRLYQEMLEFGF